MHTPAADLNITIHTLLEKLTTEGQRRRIVSALEALEGKHP